MLLEYSKSFNFSQFRRFFTFFLKLNLFTDTLNMLANIYILYSSEPFKSSSFSFFLIYLFILFLFWGEGCLMHLYEKKNRLWFILKFYWLLWRKVNILNGSMLFPRLWVIYIYCNILKADSEILPAAMFLQRLHNWTFRLNNSSWSRTVWPNAGCTLSLTSTW